MGGVARSGLVSAVSRAGGFGFLGMVREPPDLIRAEVARVRESTERDFGVNLIPAATDAALLDEQVETCIALKVPVIGLFWDLSAPLVRRLRDAGRIVVCQVGSVQEAEAAQSAGAHALIAQGWEAGGHVRGESALMPLLSGILQRSRIPVLAAGGIVNGRGLAAALSMGAQGAVIGTAFLATQESFAHAYHKQRIVEARPGETVHTDAFHINWPMGAHVRVLPNSVTRGQHGDPFSGSKTVIGEEEGRPIYLFSTDSPLRSMTGDFEAMALYAGQGAGEIDAIPTAGERLNAIVAEALSLLAPGTASTAGVAAAVEMNSPPCSVREAGDSYMGYASREEILDVLNVLLEAERAGARVTLRTSLEADAPRVKEIAAAIHRDEAHWCAILLNAIRHLDGTPSPRTGAFYGKAMAIADLPARLAFLNRGQGWVVRKLREMLPKIRDDALYRDLDAMLSSHEQNIDKVAKSGLADPA
jgi:nitronate monooxygenase